MRPLLLFAVFAAVYLPQVVLAQDADLRPLSWHTTADSSWLLHKVDAWVDGLDADAVLSTIHVDTAITYQTVEGFGYTLTGGSAALIQRMSDGPRRQLVDELFGCGEGQRCISYLRLSMGASDLDSMVFSYCDQVTEGGGFNLDNFSLAYDTLYLVPLLRDILAVHPTLQIMATPWSPPVWMKDNGASKGGSLRREMYALYADYFVRYIQAMKDNGIPIHAVTVQNEPHHGGNNPSMVMEADEQAAFIREQLGPAFARAGIDTKILLWDHNCDNPEYPISILDDAETRGFVAGSAFHLYAGDIAALGKVQQAHPDKKLYFTEQWTGSKGAFHGDFLWHARHVVLGSQRNWAVATLEWNLANDPNFGPHTPGGCTQCKGALTIDGDYVTRNVSYYIIAQISAFVPAGSVRVHSSSRNNDLQHLAYRRPDGKMTLLVLNEGKEEEVFLLSSGRQLGTLSIKAESMAAFVWY